MPRSDWNILAPVAGLAALFTAFALGAYVTALDNPEQGYPRYSDAREQGQEANAATSINLANPAQYRAPCANPQRESESDLCAQWRAANAAEQSALWTKLGFWAGLFGLIGLYWQVILTRRAVEDTGDATEAMREANEIARQSVRPWLKLFVDSEFYFIPGDDGSSPLIKIDAEAQNFGNAPAVNVTVQVSLLKGRSFHIAKELQRLTERGAHLGIYGTAIHPTDKRELERDTRFGVVEIEMPDPHDGAHPMIATVYYLGVAVFYRSPNTPGTFYTAAFFRFRDPTPPKTPAYWYSERIGGEHHGVAVAVAT